MAKYLQDIIFLQPALHPKGLTDEKVKRYRELYSESLISVGLISFLFNQHIESNKYVTAKNIWRLIIELTNEKENHNQFEDSPEVVTLKRYFDNDQLLALNKLDRKKMLLDIFTEGLDEISKLIDFDKDLFPSIRRKILDDDLIFDKSVLVNKLSPNKKILAKVWGFVTEEEEKTYVVIRNQITNDEHKILIGDFIFENFDRIQWIDNNTIYLYQVDDIQSYRRKKVAKDYFKIDILEPKVTYLPQTREYIFDYGVKLLTETDNFDEGLDLIKQAKEMGHGKAKNILINLEINPQNRNKAELLQMPKAVKMTKILRG